MSSGPNQDWRGGRERRGRDPKAEAPQPSWKRSRVRAAAGPPGVRPRRRILLPIMLLGILVACAVILYQINRPVDVHLISLNLLEGSAHFDPAVLPAFPEPESPDPARWKNVRHFPFASLKISEGGEEAAEKAATAGADVVVVYLQSSILPGPSGSFLCLIKNSTPDLVDNSEYEELSRLRERLRQFADTHRDQPLLLLIDQPPQADLSRAGAVQPAVLDELSKWSGTGPDQVPGLVTIVSSSAGEISHAVGVGGAGRTVFGHFVAAGLSNLADQDKDGMLHLLEFHDFLTTEVDQWVRTHRDEAGQHVKMFPAADEVRANQQKLNFLVMKDMPIISAPAISGQANLSTVETIGELWSLRDSLRQQRGELWSPLAWQRATESLRRAEHACLTGNHAAADRALKNARESLKFVSEATNAVFVNTAGFHQQRGLPESWFQTLPSQSRMTGVWPPNADPNAKPSPPAPPSPVITGEEVLAEHIRRFPFQQMRVEPPQQARVDEVLKRRTLAETAAAELLGCADLVRRTMLKAERSALIAEDTLFVRPTTDATAPVPAESAILSDSETTVLLQALREFGPAYQTGVTSHAAALDLAPTLALWAGTTQVGSNPQSDAAWVELLMQAPADSEPTQALVEQLADRAGLLAAVTADDHTGMAVHLKSAAFRLVLVTRRLQSLLTVVEPETGFTPARMAEVNQQLTQATAAADAAIADVRRLLSESGAAAVATFPSTRIERIRRYQFLHSLLTVTGLDAKNRAAILSHLVKLDEKLNENDAADASAGVGNKQTVAAASSGDGKSDTGSADTAKRSAGETAGKTTDSGISSQQRMLWILQGLNLLPGSPATHPARESWKAASTLTSSEVSPHESLAGFGTAVRNLWRQNRRSIESAVKSNAPDALATVRHADLQSRMSSAFDAEKLLTVVNQLSVQKKLRQLELLEYSLLHVDRLLESQWVEFTDAEKWTANGWYARSAKPWMRVAELSEKNARFGAAGTSAVHGPAIQSRYTVFDASESLRLVPVPSKSVVALTDDNVERSALTARIESVGISNQNGIGALCILPEQPSGESVLRTENNGAPVRLPPVAGDIDLTITRVVAPVPAPCEPLQLRSSVFYRGRRWTSETTIAVNACAEPEFIVELRPRPETAALTVTGADSRPIVFVLDWSGSMNDPLNAGQPTLRRDAALDALLSLIEDPYLTANAKAILKVFGHRRNQTLDKGVYGAESNQSYIANFGPIPADIPPLQDIESVMPLQILDKNGKSHFKDILEKLRKSGPFGITPLASAIIEALEVDLVNKAGIVIAVTDGQALDIGPRKDGKPDAGNDQRKKRLKELLESNPETKVVIVAFGFKPGDPERAALDQVFSTECGITVIDAADKEQLKAQIFASLDPRQYAVSSAARGLNATADLDRAMNALPPATDYRIEFGGIATDVDIGPVTLERGDALTLTPNWNDGNFRFDRTRFTELRADAAAPAAESDTSSGVPTMLRATQAPRFADRPPRDGERMSAVEISLGLDHERRDLPVRQPAEIRFSFSPRGGTFLPRRITQSFTSEWGTPGWNFEIDEWPSQYEVVVAAQWKMQPTTPEIIQRVGDLKAADQSANAIRLGGSDSRLPLVLCRVLLKDGTLQVRLDDDPTVTYSEGNRVTDIRVQIGNVDLLDQKSGFRHDEVPVTIRRTPARAATGGGSIVYEFHGSFTEEQIADRKLSLTSGAAMSDGAWALKEPLLLRGRR